MFQEEQLSRSRVSLTTNSTSRNRIMRKPELNGRHSRSKSRDRIQNNSFTTHFIKTISFKQDKPQVEQKQPALRRFRNDIANQTQPRMIMKQKEKKREPTPAKSYKEMKKNQAKQSNSNFEWQIKMAEMENKMMQERKLREKYEKKSLKNDRELIQLRQLSQRLQIDNKSLRKENKEMQNKIKELEGTIMESENNLITAKTNLQKLRQTIKENRLLQLQGENRKIKKELDESQRSKKLLKDETEELRHKFAQLTEKHRQATKKLDIEKRIKEESMREKYLTQEISQLKKSLLTSKEEKERFLEDKVDEAQRKIREINEEKKGLEIKLHMLEKVKNEEVLELKRKKESQLKVLRVKYSKLLQEMKGSSERMVQSEILKTRKKQEYFSFDLSPEK